MLFGCGNYRSERRLKTVADSFALTWFNWQYSKSIRFCTDSAQRHVIFMASNVNEEDVELLRNKECDAVVERKEIEYVNDSTAIAFYDVSDFLHPDTIGKAAQKIDKAEAELTLKRVENTWKVARLKTNL